MGDTYQASHILVKHEGSRRKASWKDPEGAVIAGRTRAEAVVETHRLEDGVAVNHKQAVRTDP
jgi:NIMA-interacting peptidyl-prolyl cis-trans isomerase 1